MFFYHDLFHVKLNVKHANLTQSLEMDNRHGWRVCPREAIILASFLSSPNNSILGHHMRERAYVYKEEKLSLCEVLCLYFNSQARVTYVYLR